MACNQTLTAILKDCLPSMGGIVEAYFANRDDIQEVVVFEDDIIQNISMMVGKEFVKVQFPRNTGSMSSNYTIDHTTGVKFVTTDLVIVLNRMNTEKRVALKALSENDLVVIVKDANGKYWYLGFDEAVKATAGDGLTGTARADRNGYSLTLQDNSYHMPYEVSSEVIENLL